MTKNNRPKPLYGMFTAVPPRYDLINTIITLGLDKRWRQKAADACLDGSPAKVLDLCCGTADLAVNIAGDANYGIEMHGMDYSQPMLDLAEIKAERLGKDKKITFQQGEVSDMPYEDGYFNTIGISFAFRNLTYKNQLVKRHMEEILRVLAPGGHFVIVESSQPRSAFIRKLFHWYLRYYLANIGWWISGNKGAYKYLGESAIDYFSPDDMEKFLLESGFSKVTYKPLFFGAAGVYVAVK